MEEWESYKTTVTKNAAVEKHKQTIKSSQNKKPEVVLPTPKVVRLSKTFIEVEPRLLNDTSSVNHNLIKKIKSNKQPIDIIIDLHGYNREEAYQVFIQKFCLALHESYKIILVITGKGQVLREALSSWLYEPLIANRVFYFTQASQARGGEGAFYLALTKK